MRLNAYCLNCIIGRQERNIHEFTDEEKKARYMKEVMRLLGESDDEASAPGMVAQISEIYERCFGETEGFTEIKKEYNQLTLNLEKDLEQKIRSQPDVLHAALCYARIGNYIDFLAMEQVDKQKMLQMFEDEDKQPLDPVEYDYFLMDLKKAKRLVYLADNCGEIVLDKIAVRILKEQYPELQITVVVRGMDVGNDATMEDAEMVGMTKEVTVIGNGNNVGGTELALLSPQAREVLEQADVILAKGQGNYETLNGCGMNIYYLFLCKCNWFAERFRVPLYEGMFVSERRS